MTWTEHICFSCRMSRKITFVFWRQAQLFGTVFLVCEIKKYQAIDVFQEHPDLLQGLQYDVREDGIDRWPVSMLSSLCLLCSCIQNFCLLPGFSYFLPSVRKERAILPVIYWSYTCIRAFYYHWQFSPAAGDAESVLNTVWHGSVLHQRLSDRATAERFSFRRADKTLVWENRLVLQVPKVISGEVIW